MIDSFIRLFNTRQHSRVVECVLIECVTSRIDTFYRVVECVTSRIDTYYRVVECVTSRIDTYYRVVECVTFMIDIYYRVVECVTSRIDTYPVEIRQRPNTIAKDLFVCSKVLKTK